MHCIDDNTTLKAGTLFKRGSGEGLLHRRNWKARYFRLTRSTLAYYDHQGGAEKGSINLLGCVCTDLELMPPDCVKTGSSASTNWRMAIHSPGRRFLIAAATEADMLDWAAALHAVFQANEGLLERSRASIMLKSKPRESIKGDGARPPTYFEKATLQAQKTRSGVV
ncbi:Aste57867_12866 [Aphanomyces stellatus]|uniref:Aste57867_12866 protein n=1 Tax=Aphanomyces stellatus TaxID=120398 RepID=A0A485KYP9_9STRA|nr:hypothetical protein As57867_012818 [Aphanomyces stellatus]VFT89713.1 Aste57867_12866 [Aphanomyces stellatus]